MCSCVFIFFLHIIPLPITTSLQQSSTHTVTFMMSDLTHRGLAFYCDRISLLVLCNKFKQALTTIKEKIVELHSRLPVTSYILMGVTLGDSS